MRPVPLALFKCEYKRVIRTGDAKACRALQRLRKRWIANEASLKAGDLRKLEMLNMLRDQVIKAKWTTGEATSGSGYWEALRGGDRPLSDEAWQGRLTAREIHSRLADAGVLVDQELERGQLHEIRRLARKLGIRLAEDQRGRKRKPYLGKQEPKRPLDAHALSQI